MKYELGSPDANTNIGASRLCEPAVATASSVLSDWIPETLPERRKEPPSRPVSLMWCTMPLVKNAIIVFDASPFRHWYESHYLLPLGKKRDVKAEKEDVLAKKRSKRVVKKYVKRQKTAKLDHALEKQFNAGRLLASIASRS